MPFRPKNKHFNTTSRGPLYDQFQNQGKAVQFQNPKVYHDDITDSQSEHSEQEPEAYQADQSENDGDNNADYYTSPDPQAFFTSHTPEVVHSCRHCDETFASKNTLFKHLRSELEKPVKYITSDSSDEEITSSAHKSDTTPELDTPQPALVAESVDEKLQIIESISKLTGKPDYGFRGYYYVTAAFKINDQDFPVCIDTGCAMTLIDRKLFKDIILTVKPSLISSPISVRGLGESVHKTKKYIHVIVDLKGKSKNKSVTGRLIIEAHVVENLRANMLVDNNVIEPQRMRIDPANRELVIGAC